MSKILIIRSLQAPLLINYIKNNLKNNDLFLLENHKQINILNESKLFTNIFLTKKIGDFSIFNLSLKTLLEIRQEEFDMVVVPRVNLKFDGFENILIMIFFFKITNLYEFSYQNIYDSQTIKLNKINKNTIFIIFIFKIISFLISLPSFILFWIFLKISILYKKLVEK